MLLGEGCDKRMHPLKSALRRLDAVPERDTQTGSKSHFTGFSGKPAFLRRQHLRNVATVEVVFRLADVSAENWRYVSKKFAHHRIAIHFHGHQI